MRELGNLGINIILSKNHFLQILSSELFTEIDKISIDIRYICRNLLLWILDSDLISMVTQFYQKSLQFSNVLYV